MHGIDQITQMVIFYHVMNYSSKGIIDVACYGAFKRNSDKEALRNHENFLYGSGVQQSQRPR